MFFRARSYWLAVGAALYAAVAALIASRTEPGSVGHGPFDVATLPWVAIVGVPIALAAAWSATAPASHGEDTVEEGARAAARTCFAGVGLFLAAQSGPESPGLTALSNLGAAMAAIGSLWSLARIPSWGGLIEPPAAARSLDSALFAALCWTVAIMLPAARSLFGRRTAALDPVVLEYATVAASTASLGLSIATAARVRSSRRLELGVEGRATAALLLSVAALVTAVLAAAVSVASPDRVLPFAATIASAAIALSTVARDPGGLARTLRLALAVTILATPPALIAVFVTHASPHRAASAVYAACGACAIAGLASRSFARFLAPDRTRWLDAMARGLEAALNPDPDAALEAALFALQEAGGRGASPSALFRLAPVEIVTVDRAGFAHAEKTDVPERLATIAAEEPERILRVEVARATQVRRPELRPIVSWLGRHGLAAVAVVQDELAPVALLGIPEGARTAPTSLEEVRALRALADRLTAVISVSASLARSREREMSARTDHKALVDEVSQAHAARDRAAGRLAAIARMLERPARVASYSPSARTTIEQLERLGAAGKPITLLSAPGVDAVAWAALTHLASERRGGPFTVIDATSPAEHDLMRWRDANDSPLAEAKGGTLVLIDAHALPLDVQGYIGAAATDEASLIASVPATVDAMVARGTLHERLADRLGDRAVALPTLASRAEDLRALAVEQLARIGVRLQSRPLGLSPPALAALLNYEWPGNDAELYATLLRAALVTKGDVIGTKELSLVTMGMVTTTAQEEPKGHLVSGSRASSSRKPRRPR